MEEAGAVGAAAEGARSRPEHFVRFMLDGRIEVILIPGDRPGTKVEVSRVVLSGADRNHAVVAIRLCKIAERIPVRSEALAGPESERSCGCIRDVDEIGAEGIRRWRGRCRVIRTCPSGDQGITEAGVIEPIERGGTLR